MNTQEVKLKYNLEVLENKPLAEFTTYKIGGPAKYFVTVKNVVELRQALQVVVDNKLKYFILGGGSNILVSDDGFDGLVIHLDGSEVEYNGTKAKVFAGMYWPKFVIDTVKNDCEGLEFFGNIPGQVGGCIRGNAGAYGKASGDFVEEVEVFEVSDDEVSLKVLNKEECEFAYRESIFKKKDNWVIASVTFKLNKLTTSQEERLKLVAEEGATRCAKQPLQFPSAGCAFKNIEYNESMSQFKDWISNGKLPAARFIENAGFKGKTLGGAMVSDVHANFILNKDHATASDVIQLISMVKMKVRDEYGVQLEEEIQYIGF